MYVCTFIYLRLEFYLYKYSSLKMYAECNGESELIKFRLKIQPTYIRSYKEEGEFEFCTGA